jgi:RHS repeat-associated protein
VRVVARIEVIDAISGGKLTTEFSYHHGYWDGAEREFRGFGRVDQRDTETFDEFHVDRLDTANPPFEAIPAHAFSPPTETRTWFHQGPVGDEFGEWEEIDRSDEFWPGDPQVLSRPRPLADFLKDLPRQAKRDALRSLRGSILRTELYALDGTERQDRPYTVTEHLHGVAPLPLGDSWPDHPDVWRLKVFFPHPLAERTTQWERGTDPMTRFAFTDDYDEYGQPRSQINIAVPRRRDFRMKAAESDPYLATHIVTTYAQRDDAERYIIDRVARATTFQIVNDGTPSVFTLQHGIELRTIDDVVVQGRPIVGQTLTFYDGPAFRGLLPLGQLGAFGAPVRTESLVLSEEILHEAYKSGSTVLIPAEVPPYLAPDGVPGWTSESEYPQEFRVLLPAGQPIDLSRPGLTTTPAGFGFANGAAGSPYARGYFAATARRRYDFQADQPFTACGLIRGERDPLGRDSTIDYDHFALLPTRVTDAVGLTTEAAYDYRVLQPNEVTDSNGNRIAITFTPLGLPASISVMGADNEESGDTPEQPGTTFRYDFLAFVNSPPDDRRPISVHTVNRERHRWDLVHEQNDFRAGAGQPPLTAVEVDAMFPDDEEALFPMRFLQTREYSDGYGRLLQTRTQAEDVILGHPVFGGEVLPADQDDPTATKDVVAHANADPTIPNVVVSGWQVYDNKGRVVEKYEPFFSIGWSYAAPAEGADLDQLGQKLVMHYDPRGRLIRAVNPDGSEQRVVHGVPADLAKPEQFAATPWEAYTFDANDNAGRTHPATAAGYLHHWNTPASAVVDALGRTVEDVKRNRDRPTLGNPLPPIQEFRTRSTYDISGNLLTVQDALGRDAFRYVYDLNNTPLRVQSIDAGLRRMVFDAGGNLLEQRDGKGALAVYGYDLLSRPSRRWARDEPTTTTTLRERLEYGDGGSPEQPPDERDANRTLNRLGRLHRLYDEAGLQTISAYDFKANVRVRSRRVIADEAILAVFEPPPPGWQVVAFRVDWQPKDGVTPEAHAESLLEATEYRTTLFYDALNRITTIRYPRDVAGERKELRRGYNRAGALERIELDGVPLVEQIAYNAKGQRTLVAYGNGVLTRHAYDPHTFRLARLRTERYSQPEPLTFHPIGAPLQDFAYRYDLAGNILSILDRVPGSGVLNNPASALAADPDWAELLAAGDGLLRRFEYDPLYRLLSATGRECADILTPQPWTDDPRCGFGSGNHATPDQDNAPSLTTTYREEYAYDPADNLVSLKHQGDSSAPDSLAWTRSFGMGGLTPQQWSQAWPGHVDSDQVWPDPPSNRLTHVGDDGPGAPQTHFYDANGNLVREATSRHFEWDHADRLRAYRTQPGTAEPSIHAHYLYDAGGQRVKKLVRRQGGRVDITVYVDGLFEHHRVVRSGGIQENNSLHVMDIQSRIALLRVGAPFPDDAGPALKFHLGDHLGSSSLVIDEAGGWINREEYSPYGETSFGSFSRKRYRFTGKERDEESGLNYHGARYYAPWAARWLSCDPIGVKGGPNLYRYALSLPTGLVDPSGEAPRPSELVGTTILDNKVIKEYRTLLEHPAFREIALEAFNNLENPNYDTLQKNIVARIYNILKSDAPHKLKQLLEIGTRGGKQALIFRTGPFQGEYLEFAHTVSQKEIETLKLNNWLSVDLNNLSPVGHRFHRAYLHAEQQLSKWGTKLSAEAIDALRRYVPPVSEKVKQAMASATATAAAVRQRLVGSAGRLATNAAAAAAEGSSVLAVIGSRLTSMIPPIPKTLLKSWSQGGSGSDEI